VPGKQAGVWEKLHELLLAELHAADRLEWERAVADSSHLQAKKGRQDRAEPGRPRPPGSKHHLLVDGGGVPLAWTLTGGNRNDVTQLLEPSLSSTRVRVGSWEQPGETQTPSQRRSIHRIAWSGPRSGVPLPLANPPPPRGD
jgi:hypothetical protein